LHLSTVIAQYRRYRETFRPSILREPSGNFGVGPLGNNHGPNLAGSGDATVLASFLRLL